MAARGRRPIVQNQQDPNNSLNSPAELNGMFVEDFQEKMIRNDGVSAAHHPDAVTNDTILLRGYVEEGVKTLEKFTAYAASTETWEDKSLKLTTKLKDEARKLKNFEEEMILTQNFLLIKEEETNEMDGDVKEVNDQLEKLKLAHEEGQEVLDQDDQEQFRIDEDWKHLNSVMRRVAAKKKELDALKVEDEKNALEAVKKFEQATINRRRLIADILITNIREIEDQANMVE